jgi:hypothetical protein
MEKVVAGFEESRFEPKEHETRQMDDGERYSG